MGTSIVIDNIAYIETEEKDVINACSNCDIPKKQVDSKSYFGVQYICKYHGNCPLRVGYNFKKLIRGL